MIDRTTKLLLFLIAAALWGLLLRPSLGTAPAQAAPRPALSALPAHPGTSLALNPGIEIYLAQDGNVYRFDRRLGKAKDVSVYGRDFGPGSGVAP